MSIIKSISFKSLHVNEYFSLSQRILSVFPTIPPENLPLYALIFACQEAMDKLDAAIKKNSTKIETAELNALNKRRGDAFIGFKELSKSQTKHPDPEFREAAILLLNLIEEYGFTLNTEGKEIITTKLMNLLGDLKNRAEMAAAVIKINATAFVNEMDEAQTGYTDKQSSRSQIKAHNSEIGTSAEACDQIRNSLEHLFNHLDGSQSGVPTEKRAGWINEINQIITEYMTIIHARKTRNAHSEEEKAE